MKFKKLATISLLFALLAIVGGCHYDGDRYRDYGSNRYGTYRDGYGTYRDGFRDGRAYERRQEDWRSSRWDDRDYWRRR
jgi:hypothetical protein